MTKYHPNEFDLSTKELFQSLGLPLLQYAIGKSVQLLKALNMGFVRIESRDTDMIYEAIGDQQPAIVYLEVQSGNDKTMLSRMLRYLAEIYAVHQLKGILLIVFSKPFLYFFPKFFSSMSYSLYCMSCSTSASWYGNSCCMISTRLGCKPSFY